MRATFRIDMSRIIYSLHARAAPQPISPIACTTIRSILPRVAGVALEAGVLKAQSPSGSSAPTTRCGFVFYLDPKIAVGTVIRMPTAGSCSSDARSNPAMASGSSPAAMSIAARRSRSRRLREAREESGLEVRLDHLINIYSYAGRTPIVVVYAATYVSGDLVVDDEGLGGQRVPGRRDSVGQSWRSAAQNDATCATDLAARRR